MNIFLLLFVFRGGEGVVIDRVTVMLMWWTIVGVKRNTETMSVVRLGFFLMVFKVKV